jgi:hypothetical protein
MGGHCQAQDHVTEEREALVGLGAVLDPRGVRERLSTQILRKLGEELRE